MAIIYLKDFTPNDKAYMICIKNSVDPTTWWIEERTVKSVGRKYVTLNGLGCMGYNELKFEKIHDNDAMLYEHCDIGYRRLLFLTKHAAEQYLTAERLKKEIRWKIDNIANCSVEELEEIHSILTKNNSQH